MNYRETFVDIDLTAIRHNILELKKSAPADASLMAVVKGDAYGHGDEQILKIATKTGVEWIGVAIVKEAIKIRKLDNQIKILLLGYCPPNAYDEIVNQKITITVYSLESALSANAFARKNNIILPVHLKLDTGMARLGFSEKQLPEFLNNKNYFSHLNIDGVSSHLSSADEGNLEFSRGQIHKYYQLIDLIKQQFDPTWFHISNSAGITELREKRGNLFRMGISMYGQMPSGNLLHPPILKEALTFKSCIVQLQDYPSNTPIGYGRTFITGRQTRIATIAVGYADGYSRLLSNRGDVLIGGQRAPIIGNVCMDMIMADVTEIKKVDLYDEVILIGKQGREYISASEVADWMGTINYEVTSIISKRVPRYYHESE